MIELSHVLPISSAVRSALDPMLGERAHEGEGAGDIVVGHHERRAEAVVDIIFDRAELLHDALIGPSFEGPAQIDPDQLAQDAGVNAFEIIGGNGGHCLCFPSGEEPRALGRAFSL